MPYNDHAGVTGNVLKKTFLIFLLAALIKAILLGTLFLSANCSLEELIRFGDVRSYLKIADSYPIPYSLEGMERNVRHYPLFPFIVWFFSPVFGGNLIYAGFFSAILIGSLCCIILYLIAQQFTENAFALSLIFAVFPDKWAQVSVYPLSESIFVLLLLLAVYFHLKGNFIGAYLSLATMLLARPLGILFLFSFILFDVILEKRYFIIKYAMMATIPFVLFHGYLFILFHKLMLFVHASEYGGWGGVIFSYPFSGLVEGIKDSHLLPARKIYTLMVFGFYSIVFAFAGYHFFRTKKYQLFSAIIIPYFIFTLLLKGGGNNWWMLSLPRFLIPLTPFGLIFLLGQWREKYLYYFLGFSTVMAFAYTIGSRIMHLRHGPIV